MEVVLSLDTFLKEYRELLLILLACSHGLVDGSDSRRSLVEDILSLSLRNSTLLVRGNNTSFR